MNENLISVKCTECELEFRVNQATAQVMMRKHDGNIPCKRCKSVKTEWDHTKVQKNA